MNRLLWLLRICRWLLSVALLRVRGRLLPVCRLLWRIGWGSRRICGLLRIRRGSRSCCRQAREVSSGRRAAAKRFTIGHLLHVAKAAADAFFAIRVVCEKPDRDVGVNAGVHF